MSQDPQKSGSDPICTHRSWQSEKPALHASLHKPAVHVAVPFPAIGGGQALSHVPQWSTLPLVSTHSPPHDAKPSLQARSHTPLLQTGVAFGADPQTVPQSPQFCGSAAVSTQR
jgi:hypothetical protein